MKNIVNLFTVIIVIFLISSFSLAESVSGGSSNGTTDRIAEIDDEEDEYTDDCVDPEAVTEVVATSDRGCICNLDGNNFFEEDDVTDCDHPGCEILAGCDLAGGRGKANSGNCTGSCYVNGEVNGSCTIDDYDVISEKVGNTCTATVQAICRC